MPKNSRKLHDYLSQDLLDPIPVSFLAFYHDEIQPKINDLRQLYATEKMGSSWREFFDDTHNDYVVSCDSLPDWLRVSMNLGKQKIEPEHLHYLPFMFAEWIGYEWPEFESKGGVIGMPTSNGFGTTSTTTTYAIAHVVCSTIIERCKSEADVRKCKYSSHIRFKANTRLATLATYLAYPRQGGSGMSKSTVTTNLAEFMYDAVFAALCLHTIEHHGKPDQFGFLDERISISGAA